MHSYIYALLYKVTAGFLVRMNHQCYGVWKILRQIVSCKRLHSNL